MRDDDVKSLSQLLSVKEIHVCVFSARVVFRLKTGGGVLLQEPVVHEI